MRTASQRVDVRENDEDGSGVVLIDGQQVGPELGDFDVDVVYHWLIDGGLDAIESRARPAKEG